MSSSPLGGNQGLRSTGGKGSGGGDWHMPGNEPRGQDGLASTEDGECLGRGPRSQGCPGPKELALPSYLGVLPFTPRSGPGSWTHSRADTE